MVVFTGFVAHIHVSLVQVRPHELTA